MKFDQFAFWLQGHFELQDHFDSSSLAEAEHRKNQFLTTTQVGCIKNHIKLYFECCSRENLEPKPFICWLDGSLAYFEKLPSPQQEELILELRKRLNNLFIHAIDSTLPGDKESLQDIHDGVDVDVGNNTGKGEKKEQPIRRGKSLDGRPGGGRGRRLMC